MSGTDTRLYSHLLGSAEDHIISLNTIVTREPMMQYTVDLLNNLCLNKGVRISVAFSKPNQEFQDFFEQYFVSILPNVLRYKMYCGFIPWAIVQHPSTGDLMPVLIPIGSFSWNIRTKQQFRNKSNKNNSYSTKKRRTGNGSKEGDGFSTQDQGNVNLEHNCVSEYVVQCSDDIGVPTSDVHVINLLDPMLLNSDLGSGSRSGQDSGNPTYGQTQFSPLYVPLQKYLALDVARQRRFYADDWNTTARLFTTKHPPSAQNERAGRDEIPYGTTRFQQAQMPEGFFTYDNMQLQFQNTSNIVRDALEQAGGKGSEHVPSVYSLPAHYNLVQQPELKPLMDIDMLEKQYRISISQILGIPPALADSDSGISKTTNSDGLPFMSEMMKNTCGALTTLMNKVLLHMYSTVYYNEISLKMGPRPASTVRFNFQTDELYSESMRDREDEQIRLHKSSSSNTNGNTSSKNK
jgi:hypothetical protein